MAGNLCRCGAYPRIEEAIADVAQADPDREGGRGPLRGASGPSSRRTRSSSGPPGRSTSSAAGAARRRAPARARRGALHGRRPAARDAARRRPAQPARARARRARSTSRPRSRSPGVRAALGPDDLDVLDGRARLPRRRRRGRRRRHARAGARGASSAIAVDWEALEPLLDPDEAVDARLAHRASRALRARRPRARPRRGRRRRRGRVPDAGRPAQLDGDPPAPSATGRATRSTSTSRRSTSGASAPSVAEAVRPPAGPGARRLRVHGRRLRLEERRRRLHAHRRRARAADGPAGPLRAHAARGEPRRGQPQRDHPAAARRRARGRHARRRSAASSSTPSAGAAGRRHGGPMQMLYACENVAHVVHGAKLNTPPMAAFRAPGFVEGTFGLECLLDELAAKLELDPLELRRRNHADADLLDGRPVLVEEPDGVLPPRRAALGAAARGARALGRRGSAASGSRARSGTAAAARPRTRGCGSARTAARPWSRRCRTSARARGRRWRRSRPRSSASRSTASRVELGDSARGPYASISAGSSTMPSMGPAVRAAAGRRGAADPRDRRAALRPRASASLSLEGRAASSAPTAARGRSRRSLGLLDDAPDPRQGRARPEPDRACASSPSASRSPRSPSTSRPARCASSASPRSTTSAAIINPLGARSQVEGGIIQALGHTLSEQRLLDPATGTVADADARRLQGADDRRRARDRRRVRRRARRAPDEPRLEGPRRAADHPDAPPRSRTRSATRPAPTSARCRSRARRCCARCARRASATGDGAVGAPAA